MLAAAILFPALYASAAPNLTLSKSGPANVLAGEPVDYELTASNNGDDSAYNISFREVLEPGVSYVPGSTNPAGAGDPRVIVDSETGETTLIWTNVADIQPGGTFSFSFSALPDPSVHPVGSIITNQAQVFANENPRFVPSFNAAGEPIPASYDVDATSPARQTAITAIEIAKAEPSPEGELLRGVHDQWTVYTLNVRTTEEGGTDNVVVTDMLPAQLEFLGCGGTDNSTTEEFPGSGPLGNFSVPGSDCLTPVSVETVVDPLADGTTTYPAGVYTRVTWDLGSLPAGTDLTITYAAGIPLRANAPFPGTAPTPESLEQAANLDNNTGPSTRELEDETSITDVARASGSYLGDVLGNDPNLRNVADDDRLSRTIEDIRMRKASLNGPDPGTTVTNTATVEGGSAHQPPLTDSASVTRPTPQPPATTPPSTPPTRGPGGLLPRTGLAIAALAAIAGAMLFTGGSLLSIRRRESG